MSLLPALSTPVVIKAQNGAVILKFYDITLDTNVYLAFPDRDSFSEYLDAFLAGVKSDLLHHAFGEENT